LNATIVAPAKTDRRLILFRADRFRQNPRRCHRCCSGTDCSATGQVVILQPPGWPRGCSRRAWPQELGVRLANEVGYQIRFENVTSPRTKIRFCNGGVLLRK